MNQFIELLREIYFSAKERTKSPIASTFIISFVVSNWKSFAIFIYSPEHIYDILIKINNTANIYTTLLYPLLITTFYLIVIPYLQSQIDSITLKSHLNRMQNAHAKQIKKKQNLLETAGYDKEIIKAKTFSNDILDLNKTNSELTDLNKQQKNLINGLETEITELRNRILLPKSDFDKIADENYNQDVERFLNDYIEFSKTEFFNEFNELGIDIISGNQIKTPYQIGKMEKLSALGIAIKIQNNASIIYKFTPKGEFFWKNYQLEQL